MNAVDRHTGLQGENLPDHCGSLPVVLKTAHAECNPQNEDVDTGVEMDGVEGG